MSGKTDKGLNQIAKAPVQRRNPPLPPAGQQDLFPAQPEEEWPLAADLDARIHEFLKHTKSEQTWNAYESDWADFQNWCRKYHRRPLPASVDTVCGYLADRAYSITVATLKRRISSISQVHEASHTESPTHHLRVRELMKGIVHRHGVSAPNAKKPIRLRELREMMSSLKNDAIGVRDRSLLLLGFSGGFRRSELVALHWEHLEWHEEGILVHIVRSKTDQQGAGQVKGILPFRNNPDICPIRALQAWKDLVQLYSLPLTGPVFRQVGRRGKPTSLALSDKAVVRAIKRTLGLAIVDKRLTMADLMKYAGHSLRAGFITTAAEAGVTEREIMDQTGQRNTATVRRYIRDSDALRQNPLGKMGL